MQKKRVREGQKVALGSGGSEDNQNELGEDRGHRKGRGQGVFKQCSFFSGAGIGD